MERSMRDNPFVAPVEPALELDDIQGAAVPGFLKPFQTLIGVQCPAGKEASFRKLVGPLPTRKRCEANVEGSARAPRLATRGLHQKAHRFDGCLL
jgi:hypothetical protein